MRLILRQLRGSSKLRAHIGPVFEALAKEAFDVAQTLYPSDSANTLAAYVVGNIWGTPAPDQLISNAELRDVLILGDNHLRSPSCTWPKQRTDRTPEMSSALFSCASTYPDQFADMFDIVRNCFVPLTRNDNLYLECDVDDLDAAGVDALLTALELLLPTERSDWPYYGKIIVQSLVDADLGGGERRDKLAQRAAEQSY